MEFLGNVCIYSYVMIGETFHANSREKISQEIIYPYNNVPLFTLYTIIKHNFHPHHNSSHFQFGSFLFSNSSST